MQGRISIHAPRGGCDWCKYGCNAFGNISIHAPRGGCDGKDSTILKHLVEFQSTHPAGGATKAWENSMGQNQFQSTHPAGGATMLPKALFALPHYFNPRTPRGVRLRGRSLSDEHKKFQSTHPAGGATRGCPNGNTGRKDFNPRTPRGVRLAEASMEYVQHAFQSTHPAGGATDRRIKDERCIKFQSTHPAGGATGVQYMFSTRRNISIHAPRGGCDASAGYAKFVLKNFNPRTPRGVRRPFA